VPIRYDVHESERLLFGVGSGLVSNADLRSTMIRVLRDSRFDLSLNELWDFRECSPDDVSFDGLFQVVKGATLVLGLLTDPSTPRARCAVIVATQEQFGLARMYQSLSERLHLETEVFHDPESARRWLGLSEAWQPTVPA
jgi:hypothetical protein